jgi:hypothetical protein
VAGEEKPASPKLADLAWLAGQWTSDDGGFDEHWLAPEGDAMFAVSRMVAGGKTKMCELSGIEETAEGLVFRIRHYSKTLEPWKMDADGPLTMRLVESGAKKVVFEDPKKEFPRRISYERKGDELIARLEGEKGGKPAAQEFRLKPAAKD